MQPGRDNPYSAVLSASRLRWRDALTGEVVQGEEALWLREVLRHLPVALLINESGPG